MSLGSWQNFIDDKIKREGFLDGDESVFLFFFMSVTEVFSTSTVKSVDKDFILLQPKSWTLFKKEIKELVVVQGSCGWVDCWIGVLFHPPSLLIRK